MVMKILRKDIVTTDNQGDFNAGIEKKLGDGAS
jgi:hypothetical protein